MTTLLALGVLFHQVIGVEIPIGLILHENVQKLERAFDFATMVLNNNNNNNNKNYNNDRNNSQHRKFLYPVGRNRTDLTDDYKMGSAICSLVGDGVHAVVGTSHPSTFNTIQSYSHALKVPVILASSTRVTAPDRYLYDVSTSPPFMEAVMRVIAGLPRNHTLYYVYDTDDGLWRLQRLYSFFQQRQDLARSVDAYRIRDTNSAYAVLRRLDMKSDDRKTIVLDLDSAHAYKTVLEQIVDVGMNRDEYHYILTCAGALDLEIQSDFYSQFLYGGVNITAFGFINNSSEVYRMWEQQWRKYQEQFPDLFPITSDTALMLDAVRTAYEAVQKTRNLPKSTTRGRGQTDFRCRLDQPQPSSVVGDQIIDSIEKVEFEGLTGPVRFTERKRIDYTIDVYSLSFKQKMKKIDSWRASELNPETFGSFLPDVIVPNATQRVTTYMEEPFVIQVANSNGEPAIGGKHLDGYCIDLLKMVALRVGFDYHIKLSTGYGAATKQGVWDGMIGELVRKESDIAVAPLSITESRERVVDFTKPFMNTGISIMIKKPDRQKPGVFSFMEPLDMYVWLCIVVGFLAVSFVLFFVGRFSPYEWSVRQSGNKDPTATNAFTISNTLWFSLGALMQQGSDISPRSLSGRLIGSAWWFFTLIIISSYTANLAAFLTIEKLISPIHSADDLVKQSTIKYGTLKRGTTWKFFEESTHPTYSKMKEVMLQSPAESLLENVMEGVSKVRASKHDFAFLLESSMNNYHGQQKPCDVMKVGENLDNKGYGIATWINHPLKHNINIAVLNLGEIGELYKLEQKWWYDKGQCGDVSASKDSAGTQTALTLSNVSGIFHILIGGLVLSMITSSIEYLVQRHLKSRKAKAQVCRAPPPPPPPPPRRPYVHAPAARASYRCPDYENELNQEKLGATSHLMSFEHPERYGEQTDI